MDVISNMLNSIAALLEPLVTPDWGELVGLIPLLLLVLVVGYVVWMVLRWTRFSLHLPASLKRRVRIRGTALAYLGGVVLGLGTCLLAFATGGSAEDGTLGLTVNLPMLLVGLVIAIGSAGIAAVRWEDGTVDEDTGEVDPSARWLAEHRRPITLLLVFVVGVAIAALGLLLLPPPDADGVQPVATIPLLVLGLVMALVAAGRAVLLLFPQHDGDEDLVPSGGTPAP